MIFIFEHFFIMFFFVCLSNVTEKGGSKHGVHQRNGAILGTSSEVLSIGT